MIQAVQEVRSTVSSTGADAIFMTSNTNAALPFFAQLLPESGVNPAVTQYIGLTRWDVPPQTLDLQGLEGGWFALPDPARSGEFSARYQAAYGSGPHPLAGLAYDGIAAIGALVQQGKSDALTASALTQGAGFQGVEGVFRFRPNGVVERGLAVATIRDKQVVVIDPHRAASPASVSDPPASSGSGKIPAPLAEARASRRSKTQNGGHTAPVFRIYPLANAPRYILYSPMKNASSSGPARTSASSPSAPQVALPEDLILPAQEILDPAALCAAIDAARKAHADDKAFRKAAITLLQEAQEQGRARIKAAFEETPASPAPPPAPIPG